MQSVESSQSAEPMVEAPVAVPVPATAAEATVETATKTPVEAARESAAQFLSEGKFAEAKASLEEAEALEAGPKPTLFGSSKERFQKFVSGLDARIRRVKETKGEPLSGEPIVSEAAAPEAPPVVTLEHPIDGLAESAVEEAVKIVDSYSKIAAGVGLLPTFVLNFAGVLAVQITMVSKIAKAFNQTEGKEKVRGSILALLGSVLPGTVGHGIGIAVASIPAVIAGTVLSFVLAPALAYALTCAIGKVFIMHFESGGTLLTFDPKMFRTHFAQAFKDAGGTMPETVAATESPAAAA